MSGMDATFAAGVARLFVEAANFWAALGCGYPVRLSPAWPVNRPDDRCAMENLFWD